jgi:phosphatidylinositol alpha 1,6-mannosyltransferase
MRIAIITESFPPDVNGVAHSVVRVAEHLVDRGHRPLVIAPEPGSGTRRVTGPLRYPVVRVPSIPMPGYPSFRLGLPSRRITDAVVGHGTDLVHLAGPFFLGARGSAVAQHLRLPTIAVFQTDVPSYAAAYKLGGLGEATAWRWVRAIHNAAERTLAPSTASATALHARGIERVWLWRRGVDTVRFDPRHRSAAVRRALAPNGELLIGYVGRLAIEKRVDLLAGVSKLPGTRLVVIGDGPAGPSVRKALPDAVFLGMREGAQLARLYASMDIFVHSGPYETFGQTIQEASASGLPVVAPASGGPVDLVEDGVTGLLVPPLSESALTDGVAKLVADGDLRASMAAAARELMLGRSWSAIGDQLIDHYADVLGATFPAKLPVVGASGVAA